MSEGFASLIYCALLSSRPSATACTSPRSAVRIIVDCMHGKHRDASHRTPHQNATGIHTIRRCRREAKSGQPAFSVFPTNSSSRNSDVKLPREAAKRHLDVVRHPGVSPLYSAHRPSKSSLVWLANPRTLPFYLPVASIHSSSRVYTNPKPAHKTESLYKDQQGALDRFRSCITALDPDAVSDSAQAWDSFEVLQASGALPALSNEDLEAFASQALDSSRLSLDGPKLPLKNTAARLGQLHDELQRRVESSADSQESTLPVWPNAVAVQALIVAGKLDRALQILTDNIVLSGEHAGPQHIMSLHQLFLASTRQRSLEDGLTILAKSWFHIREYFGPDPPVMYGKMQEAVDMFRNSVTLALGTVEESGSFLQAIEDTAVREVGASILAIVYGEQRSADQNHAAYRDFVSRNLSMPLETHLRFFKTLLSKEAYSSAYDVREHIRSQFPTKEAAQELTAALDLFPDLGKSAPPGRDVLSYRVHSEARTRFFSCIERPESRGNLASAWEDLEALNILREVNLLDNVPTISDNDILAFARRVVDATCAKLDVWDVPDPTKFANILDQAIAELNRRISSKWGDPNAENPFTRPLLWHSLILKEDLLTVGDMLVQDRSRWKFPDYVRTVTQLFVTALRLQTFRDAFQYLVPLWPVVIRHLEDARTRYMGEMGLESAELRKAIFTVFGAVEDPVAWILTIPSTPEAQSIAAHLFIVLFHDRKDSDTAWHLFEDLQGRRLVVSYEAHILLMKTFMRDHAFELANRVHHSLRSRFPERTEDPQVRGKDELHTTLRLFSFQGNVERVEECFGIMEARGFVDGGARRRLMHVHAVNGNTDRVHELFYRFFPREGSSILPDTHDFREVVYAHVRAGDLDGVNQWLDEMATANIQPDVSMYNMILFAFATLTDLESASAVMARMYENGVQPNRISFTTVISIMADRKDPIAAEQLYQRALDEGVEPDDVMTMALMNAHIEASSWRGVIRAFDYLQRPGHKNSHRLAQLYNTLLKAYVLIGAPFRVVSDIFRRFERLKLEPSERTYALLIQSACDAGRMDVARDLFLDLEGMDAHGSGKSHITAYNMTIIMAGFLRKGEKERAKAVYDDMQARGIQPTAVTFGVIIQSYANERSEESLQIAEDFMRSLLSAEESQRAWIGSARGGRPKALESVFSPLITIYGRELDVAAVERQFDGMLEAGGEPTLISLTMLMDAYRRVNNPDGAKQVWEDIVEIALRSSQGDLTLRLPSQVHSPPKTRVGPQRQANLLCLSLSIYIDALSAAGRHVDIATTWRHIKDLGFTFDAHNWNHLAVALVRAGEVERAFEIVERVLVPYQIQTQKFVRARPKDPKTPLTFVRAADAEAEEEEEEEPEEQTRAPSNPPNRRPQDVRTATWLQNELSPVYDLDSDPAQPLHELHQISLSGQGWRTHNVTLDALGAALKRFEAGLRVLPAGETLRPEDDPRRMSPTDADEFYARTRQEVGATLGRIHQNYPNAVGLVERRELELQRIWDTAKTTSTADTS